MELGGYAWEKAGQIWYVTLRDKLGANSRFTDAAAQTYQVAAELFGAGSLEQQAVKKGWEAVGLTVDGGAPTPTPTPTPGDGCLASLGVESSCIANLLTRNTSHFLDIFQSVLSQTLAKGFEIVGPSGDEFLV